MCIYKGKMQRRYVANAASRRCTIYLSVNTFHWKVFTIKVIKWLKKTEVGEENALQAL